MEVGAHDDERMQQPARLRAGFEQAGFKGRLGPDGLEQGRPVVAAIDNVITGAGKFES